MEVFRILLKAEKKKLKIKLLGQTTCRNNFSSGVKSDGFSIILNCV
jgi:hypothetical protein